MANTPIRRFAKIFLPALLGFVIGWLFFELIHKNASNNGIIYVNDMKIKIPNPCIIAYLNLEEPMFGRLFCERDEGIGLMNLSMDPRKLEGAKIKLRDKKLKSASSLFFIIQAFKKLSSRNIFCTEALRHWGDHLYV